MWRVGERLLKSGTLKQGFAVLTWDFYDFCPKVIKFVRYLKADIGVSGYIIFAGKN
jgi:hypothetical protein